MQPNQITPDSQTPTPTNNLAQRGTHGSLTIQPLSSEETIREAADKATTIISQSDITPVASVPVVSEPIAEAAVLVPEVLSESIESHKPKKHRVRFIVFLVLAIGQVYWLGDLAASAVSTLNSGRLDILLTGVLLGCVVLLRYIQIYRLDGFNLPRRRDKVYTVLAVLPVAIYTLCIALMFLTIQLKSLQLSLVLLAGIASVSELGVLILAVATIGLGATARKRTGFRRIAYLWPLLLFLLAPIITVALVGSPQQGSQLGVAEKAQLEQAKTNMSSYLTDRYGMDFTIQDIQFVKTSTPTNGTRLVTAKVSPAKDPSFRYSAGAYLYKDISVSTGEMKDATKYQEDFIGEYWKYGFEKNICPTVRSFQKNITVTSCTVTSYDMRVKYNDVLAKYRGNVPSFSQLEETSKALLNFGLTVKTNDDNYLNDVPQHADFLVSLRSSVQNTHATSTIEYHSGSKTAANKQLTYYGTTDTSTVGGRQTVLTHIYQEDTNSSHIPWGGSNILYYNTQSGKFDLAKPEA